ncbi:MAG: HD domain-containing protein, partial [Atopostipes suicloacalis]|nr:HD domain-containing protein [Atopostipes suicloacalis]
GGSKDHVLYNEKNARRKNELTEENYREQDSIINHFHEKLLFLKDAMNTPLAKEIADKRTIFMEEFLVQFNEEIDFKNNPNNF